MLTRRRLFSVAAKSGMAASLATLLRNGQDQCAFAQASTTYKAVIVIAMQGGNDSNNMVIPLDDAEYSQYAALRTSLAIPSSTCHALVGTTGGRSYGMHPALINTAGIYNKGEALIVANVGPLATPTSKAQLLATPSSAPIGLLNHIAGQAEWASSGTSAMPDTGWGGRMADYLASQSGQLPPVLNAGRASIFTVGHSVQGIVVQSGSQMLVPLPADLETTILKIAEQDCRSENQIVALAAQLQIAASKQQVLLAQAQSGGPALSTVFPATAFGKTVRTVSQTINGRSVIGASRQIFFCTQGSYDTHQQQLDIHASMLQEFDDGIGALNSALKEMGLIDSVLICTHSDFNRSMQSNTVQGSDHGWGSHQLVIGGGIRGGRIVGAFPPLELGGDADLTGQGVWIPSLSVTQMTAAIGEWMGLNGLQLASVFPDLAKFPGGAVALT